MVMYLINKDVSQGLGVVVGDTERWSATETKCTNRFLPNEVSSKICNSANIKHILIFDYFQASYEQDRRLQKTLLGNQTLQHVGNYSETLTKID
jgi:hypothetical protein